MLVSPNLNTSTPTCPDDVLVERAQARDATAFRELVRRQRHGMQRLASRFVGRPSDQEDVVQNALLAAWQHLPDFERRATFGSWMHRVTINSALMFLRRQHHLQETFVADLEEWTTSREYRPGSRAHGTALHSAQPPDEALHLLELKALLTRLIAQLPPRLREVFVLRHIEGQSTKEIGALLGLSDSAVKTRVHRACRALRDALHGTTPGLAIDTVRKNRRALTA